MNGFLAVLIKEFSHIRRERGTLVFAFLIPVLQLFIFGVAIDTKIEHIRTVVFDLDGRQDAARLISAFENTRTFRVSQRVTSDDEFLHELSSGRAKVGIKIPPDFSDRLHRQEQAFVQVLVDGSDSQVAITALNTTNLLGFRQSVAVAAPLADALQVAAARDEVGAWAMPIEIRPRLLYNPDLISKNFFVPALVGIIMQVVTLFLTAFTIVREREHGTLEQLFVTPVGRAGLLLGKLVPYAVLGFVETVLVLLFMVFAFGVPIAGNLLLLLALSVLFLITALGLGLLISTLATTQLQAMQMAMIFTMPAFLLSGFMFPRENMPLPIYLVSYAIPVTHFLEILRGIILRGADFIDLVPHIVALSICCIVILALAVLRFHKQLD